MRYMNVRWIHDFPDEPSLIYSEVMEGNETRKIECYRDGRRNYASAELSTGSTILAEGLMPTPDDLATDPEFDAEEISADEFEQIWTEITHT
jgi:hypothetical protein